jgi:hypothetical protein
MRNQNGYTARIRLSLWKQWLRWVICVPKMAKKIPTLAASRA